MNHLKNQLLLDLLLQQSTLFGNVLTEVSPHAKQMLGDWGRNLQSALQELNRQANTDILIGNGPRGQALASLNMAQVAAGKRPYVSEEVMRRRLPQIIEPPRQGVWANYTDEEWKAVAPTLLDPNNGILFSDAFNNQQLKQSYQAMRHLLNNYRLNNGELLDWGIWQSRQGIADKPLDLIKFTGDEAAGLYPGVNIEQLSKEMAGGDKDRPFLLLPLESNDRTFLLATNREIRFLTRVELEDTWLLHDRCEFANADMVRAAILKWIGAGHGDEILLPGVLSNLREELDALPPMSLDDWHGALKRANHNTGGGWNVTENGYQLSLGNYFVQLRLTMNSMPVSDAAHAEPLADAPTHLIKGGLALYTCRPPHAQNEKSPTWEELPIPLRAQLCSALFEVVTMVRMLLEPVKPEADAPTAVKKVVAHDGTRRLKSPSHAKPAKKAVVKKTAVKKAVKKSAPRKGR